MGRAERLPRAWPNAIEALVAVGELRLAREYRDLFRERAERCHCPWALATAARCLGLLRAAEGDRDGAFAAFEQALVEHRRTPGPFERARTLLSYGVALRRAKRRGEARSRIEEAMAVFDELGARLWSARAREEFARVGGRQRSGPELTPTEERIARLVASGASNTEVAAELFVSVRTVESNLTRVYSKLGVKSRTELADRARGPVRSCRDRDHLIDTLAAGGMAERTKATVLKTVRGASPSRVRIPVPPLVIGQKGSRMSSAQLYDTIGTTYTVTRRTERRIAARIWLRLATPGQC